ncbi:WXG100 family type VII secretion target [Streptomyces sp. NPDC047014]|uniref:WXG100 family type VII secretion target n=1 Tax=Streptomyces sp. NPDC047014 TaxID=3155736 RepID=UPI0033E4A050
MVASIDPEKVESLGTQLANAADTIREIGKKLKDHQVKGWEGEAATAFQEWVNQAGSATLELAKYSTNGGKYMTEAATIMREVKPTADGGGNMPQYSAAAETQLKENLATSRKYHNDPDAVQLGQEAWSKLSGDHARAVDAMNKLAGAYEQSTTQMNNAKIPTFPPPPQVLVPPDYYSSSEDMARPGGVSGGSPSSASAYTGHGPSHGTPSDDSAAVLGRSAHPDGRVPSAPVSPIPDRQIGVDLDSVATLPHPTAPVIPGPGGPPTTGPVGPAPTPFIPPVGMPPMATVKTPGPLGPGIGPYPTLGGPGVPGGRAIGTPGLPPRDSGIVGGRPVSTTGPGTGVPRGTVIGEGPHQTGRPMGGGVMGPGVGGGHYGGQSGIPAGRRLASEPGGVIGGRQSGVVGQPFTQGGSGLVRNGAGAVGPMGAHAQPPAPRRGGRQGERPDYLAEDEETWQGNRRVVPPVID